MDQQPAMAGGKDPGMCCLAAIMGLIGPRIGILVWYLVDPARWNLAFDTWIWPLLGSLFAPWTTIFYVLVFAGGVNGFDWVWIGIGIFFDLLSYTGGARARS